MTWPVTLQHGDLILRPLRRRDRRAWRNLRRTNAQWLRPWDATLPPEGEPAREVPLTFSGMLQTMRREARAGRALPWAMVFRGEFVGQLTVAGVSLGSLRSGAMGYWIGQSHAGQGITPLAVAMACDYCTDVLGLHRIEISIRPENSASIRVVEKLGLRREGLRERYLHIDGDWRDHVTYVYIAGDAPDGLVRRLRDTPGFSRVTSDTPEASSGSVSSRDRADLRGDHRTVGRGPDSDLAAPARPDQ
jgi:ribosomal-protein-alanine N-acetyltransferase